MSFPLGLQHAGRRARHPTVRRPAPTHRHCPRAGEGMRRSSCWMKPPPHWIQSPRSRCRKPSSYLCQNRTTIVIAHACTHIMHSDRFWSSRTAPSSRPAATTICCGAAGATPSFLSVCSIVNQTRWPPSPPAHKIVRQPSLFPSPAPIRHERQRTLRHCRTSAAVPSCRR